MQEKIAKQQKREEGFSLTEILVVIVIIGILVLLAMPKFTGVIEEVKSTEAKMQLRHLHELQKVFRFANDRFAATLTDIRFQQEKLVTDGGSARYRIEIVNADVGDYQARAIAVVDGDQDGIYNTWEINGDGQLREVERD